MTATTSGHLADAARHLRSVIVTGPDGLSRDPVDLAAAAQARDQVLTSLTAIHAHLFAAVRDPGAVTVMDMARHPVWGLGPALNALPRTGIVTRSPSDVAVAPPACVGARAWVGSASAVEGAAIDVARAQPDQLLSVYAWARTPPDGPSPLTPPLIAWALVADIAALTRAVATADPVLARALTTAPTDTRDGVSADEQALGWSVPGGDLTAAGRRLLAERPRQDLELVAAWVTRLAESGPLPLVYHLPERVRGAVSVPDLAVVPEALDRAVALLQASPALTSDQNVRLATGIAAIAYRLAVDAPPEPGQALTTLALAAANTARLWTQTTLAATGTGDQQAIDQVRAVTRVLAATPPGWAGAGPEQAQTVQHAAARLAVLTRTMTANLADGLAAELYVVGIPGPGPRDRPVWEPAHRWQPPRRALERAATQLEQIADQLTTTVGPRQPVLPAGTDPLQAPARDILRTALPDRPRPDHPALHPTPRTQPAPRRGPRR